MHTFTVQQVSCIGSNLPASTSFMVENYLLAQKQLRFIRFISATLNEGNDRKLFFIWPVADAVSSPV